MRSSTATPCRSYAGGLVGKGCVGAVRSPGMLDVGTGFSMNGHTGFPVTRSNTYVNDYLVSCTTASIFFPSTVMSVRIGAVVLS